MYAVGRPDGRVTAVQVHPGSPVHLATGWNAYTGTRTACGREIQFTWQQVHLREFSTARVDESFNHASPCKACLKGSPST